MAVCQAVFSFFFTFFAPTPSRLNTASLALVHQHMNHICRGQSSYRLAARNSCTLSRHSCIC